MGLLRTVLRTGAPGAGASAPDDRTARVLAHLHAARRAAREEKRRSAALTLYGIALVGAFWGAPALLAAAGAGRSGAQAPVVVSHLVAGLPVLLPSVLLSVVLLMARAAVWRGPVLVDRPSAAWLLPTPALRGPVLLPRLAASAGSAAAVALVLGGAGGFLLYGPGTRAWPAVAAAGAWAGVAAAVLGTAAGVWIERHDRFVRRAGTVLFRMVWMLVAAVAAAAGAAAAHGGAPAWAGPLFLWSGPWGWAAQPLVAATGGAAPWWGLGLTLSAVSAAGAAWAAVRQAPDIPIGALRRRATVASAVATSLVMLDLRQARAELPPLKEARSRPAVRLPVPRHRFLLMPWRDATALLRAPGRLGWAAVWAATAVACAVAAPRTGEDGQELLSFAALAAEYLAAAQLTEPARLESDDVRRSAGLPWSARGLALWHAVVPGLLLAVAVAAGAGVCAVAGAASPGLAVLSAAVPSFVAAALVSSYRGVVPPHVLAGTQTPMGSTAPVQTLVWYLRGPLAALIVTTPVLVAVTRGAPYAPSHALVQVAAGAAGLWWAGRTGQRLRTG
ncbi:hypothetical protein ACFVGY_05910 [Streptomyces sp. NPDC127106]|uniref:hypothetical protein n=1 Tax=Streptomyces sp. NPDC127106 TaxID=3345360 RepID=UPI0036291C5B